jgi:hypothetical protein
MSLRVSCLHISPFPPHSFVHSLFLPLARRVRSYSPAELRSALHATLVNPSLHCVFPLPRLRQRILRMNDGLRTYPLHRHLPRFFKRSDALLQKDWEWT